MNEGKWDRFKTVNMVTPDITYPSWIKLVREPLSAFEQTVLRDAPIVRDGGEAVALFRSRAASEEVEVAYGMGLDLSGHVLGLWESARGNVYSVDASGIGILRPAIALNAHNVIFAHNHPSGDSTPSPQDWEVWWHLFRGARDLGITILSGLVIAPDGYTDLQHEVIHERHPEWLRMAMLEEMVGPGSRSPTDRVRRDIAKTLLEILAAGVKGKGK